MQHIDWQQQRRLLRIEALGLMGGDCLLVAFEGSEALSALFEFHLVVLSKDVHMNAAQMLAQPLQFSMHTQAGDNRYFHGLISRFEVGALSEQQWRTYHVTLSPWFWFLKYPIGCQTFIAQHALQIIETCFQQQERMDYRIDGVDVSKLVQREYYVQYQESVFDFISRLLAEEGLSYYFSHTKNQHIMHIVDGCHSQVLPYYADVIRYSEADLAGQQHLHQWDQVQAFAHSQHTHADYDFKRSQYSDSIVAAMPACGWPVILRKPLQYFHYPRGAQQRYALADQQWQHYIEAAGNYVAMSAGQCFYLDETYVITALQHHVTDESHFALRNVTGASQQYRNNFRCVIATTPILPPRLPRSQLISGVQTAVVVGPEGETVYTDNYGQIKVQFDWCDDASIDRPRSGWIRTTQTIAGNRCGHVFIPHVGHQVVLDYLHGDPSRPVVSGSVYSEKNKPPYDPAAQSYISTIKTPGNELRFNDKQGQQEIYLYANKDLYCDVQHNFVEHIRGDDCKVSTKGDVSVSVGGQYSIKAATHLKLSVGDSSYILLEPNKITFSSPIITPYV